MYALSPLNNALPIEFMITVKAQRENRFTVAAHNETILSLVRLNMLAPDAALELIEKSLADVDLYRYRRALEVLKKHVLSNTMTRNIYDSNTEDSDKSSSDLLNI